MPRDRHRHDFLGEPAAALSRRCPFLAAQRKRVLIPAIDLKLLGDVLRGIRHRINAVLLLHHFIHEPPADRRVVDGVVTRERGRRLGHDERCPRHALDATGQHYVRVAGFDGAR